KGSWSTAISTPIASTAPPWRRSSSGGQSRPPGHGRPDRQPHAGGPGVRLEYLEARARPARSLAGADLTRDLIVDGERWSKGRRLTAPDLERLAAFDGEVGAMLVPEAGDLHEDDAA